MRRFTSLDLTKANKSAISKAFELDLALKPVYITFRWTQGRGLVLVRLQLQVGPDDWRDLIQNPRMDSDGSGTVQLGEFRAGDVVHARFRCRAFEAVPHAAAFAWQEHPEHHEKVSPTDANTITLAANEPWPATFEYEVL